MKTDIFQSFDHCWVFQICWHSECSTLTASSFRIGGRLVPGWPVAAERSWNALCSWMTDWPPGDQQQQRDQGALHSWASSISSSLPFPAEPLPQPQATCWLTPEGQWRFTHPARTSSRTTRAPGMSFSSVEQLKVMSLLVRAWQNVVHWGREWQTTSVSCLDNPVNSMAKGYDT